MNGDGILRRIEIHDAVPCVLPSTFALGGCTKHDETPEHEWVYFLAQSYHEREFDSERMTLLGTSPTTIFFPVRPGRIAGHMPLEQAYEWGRSGSDSFLVEQAAELREMSGKGLSTQQDHDTKKKQLLGEM